MTTFLGLVLAYSLLIAAAIALRKSRKNLAAWAILLSLIYYHPLFLNWSEFDHARFAYFLMMFPVALIALHQRAVQFHAPDPDLLKTPGTIYLAIFVVSLIGVQLQVGLANLQSTKLLSGQLVDNFSNFSILMYASGTLYAAARISRLNLRGVFIAAAFVLFFVAFGDRTQPAFIILYGFVLYAMRGKMGRASLAIPIVAFLLLYGKQLYIYFLTSDPTAFHDFSAIREGGLAEPIALMKATEVGLGLHAWLPNYLHQFPLYMTPFSLGENLHVFQDTYKQLIFPEFSASAGVGGNIILEIYWNFGYVGLSCFGVLLALAIVTFSRLSRRSSRLSMLALLMHVVLFMYLPRNSVFTMLSHEKKFFYTFMLAWAALYFRSKLARRS